MVAITLPDGNVHKFDGPVTGTEVAADIGPGLAKAALAIRVGGELCDLSSVIDSDTEVFIVTDKDEDALELICHDTAHVMAEAVQELFPGTQVTIGPTIENGFYYDFDIGRPFTLEDLEEIEIDDIAPRHGPLWVLLGPVPAARVALGDDPKGDGGSEPPVAFFRIWIAHDKDGAWQATAFMVPQSVRGDEPLVQFLVAIAAIEARTGMNFFPALSETEQAHLENSPAPPRRFGLETLACMPARYAPRWRDRGAVRLDFDRCAIH